MVFMELFPWATDNKLHREGNPYGQHRGRHSGRDVWSLIEPTVLALQEKTYFVWNDKFRTTSREVVSFAIAVSWFIMSALSLWPASQTPSIAIGLSVFKDGTKWRTHSIKVWMVVDGTGGYGGFIQHNTVSCRVCLPVHIGSVLNHFHHEVDKFFVVDVTGSAKMYRNSFLWITAFWKVFVVGTVSKASL